LTLILSRHGFDPWHPVVGWSTGDGGVGWWGGVEGDGVVPRLDEGDAWVLAMQVLALEEREIGLAMAEADALLPILCGVDLTAEDGSVDGGEGEEEMIDWRIRREEAINNVLW